MEINCLHYCTCFDEYKSSPTTVTDAKPVIVDLDTNWAFDVEFPEGGFAIYKPCCHFIDDDGNELDFSGKFPILIL